MTGEERMDKEKKIEQSWKNNNPNLPKFGKNNDINL